MRTHAYAALVREKNTLEAQLKELKTKINEQQEDILRGMEEAGVTNMTLNDGAQLVMVCTRIPKAVVSAADAYDALIAAGLDHLAVRGFHWKSLQSALIKMDEAGEPIPEEFEGHIEIFEKYGVTVRNAGKEE